MTFEGKLANRTLLKHAKNKKTACEKCGVSIDKPVSTVISSKMGSHFLCISYLETPHFVYPTKGGDAVCYCSEYCARKHNHRFK